MKDSDLKSKLNALVVPERDQDYWDSFPRTVLTRLRAARQRNGPGVPH